MPRARPAERLDGHGTAFASWSGHASRPRSPAPERAEAQAWASFARLRLLDLDGAAAAAGEARAAAVAARDHAATSIAMASLAVVSENRGHLREALQIADDAVLLADQSPGRLGHRYPVHIPRGFILVALDRLDEARTTIETGRRISEEHGIRWPLASYHAVRAFERFIAGHWDDAIAEIEAGAGLASETGHSYSLILGRGVLSLIRLHRNDLPGARDAAGVTAGQLPDVGPRQRQLVRVGAGPPARGRRRARAGARDPRRVLGPVRQPRAREGIPRHRGRSGPAGRWPPMMRAGPGMSRLRSPAWRLATRCPGSPAPRCAARDWPKNDAGILHAAVSAYARGSRPLELALAAEDAGAAFARQGNVARACQLLDQAITIYERLDAARDLARAEAALRQMGIRRGRHVTHRRAQSGWQSLTPSEQAVVDLVAEGLSNPQIGQRLYVSRRTVQTHLAHVFAKLHITSRAQLAAEAIRHRG